MRVQSGVGNSKPSSAASVILPLDSVCIVGKGHKVCRLLSRPCDI